MTVVGRVLFPARAAAFLGVTAGYYASYETRSVLSGRREETLSAHKRSYGPVINRVFGIDLHREGGDFDHGRMLRGVDDRGLGRLFVMNHRSALDILITIGSIDAAHVSRADLAKWPFVGRIARSVGTLFVERGNRMSGVAVLHAMARAIERGIGVIVFAEGTTYEGDEVRPFRRGAFSIAQRTGAEIVPVGIAYGGEGASFGDESFVEHMRRVAGTPRVPVGLVAGEPMGETDRALEVLAEESHARVQIAVHRARALIAAEGRDA